MKFNDRRHSPVSGGPIEAGTYPERAKAFAGMRGAAFVIRALDGEEGALAKRVPPTEPQWIAWMQYFADKGVKHGFSAKRGMMTVPTEWPEDFDPDCPTSDRYALMPRRPFKPENRARVVELLSRLGLRVSRAA